MHRGGIIFESLSKWAVLHFLKIAGFKLCVRQMTGIMVMAGNKQGCGCINGWKDGWRGGGGRAGSPWDLTSFSAYGQELRLGGCPEGGSQSFSQSSVYPYVVHPSAHTANKRTVEYGPSKSQPWQCWCLFGQFGLGKG